MSIDRPNVNDATIPGDGRIEAIQQGLASLADLDDLPVREHHASYERVHQTLRAALADLEG